VEYYHTQPSRCNPHPQTRRRAPRLTARIQVRGFFNFRGTVEFVTTQKKTGHRRPWTNEEVRALKAYSKDRTPLTVIAKKMKRTEWALRRKAAILGIGLGHHRARG